MAGTFVIRRRVARTELRREIARRFVAGLHRRQIKAIGQLGELDGLFGESVTTRSWNTMNAIAEALKK